MSWFYEPEKPIPTKHNGTMRLSRFLGVWSLFGHDGTDQASPYMDGLWRKALRHAIWHGLNVRRCLVLGVAMGSTQMLVRKHWPDAEIVGVDWEPSLYELGQKIGICRVDAKMKFTEGDATIVVPEMTGSFDLVIVDLFHGKKVAAAVTNPALQQAVATMLVPGGMLLVNCFRERAILEGWSMRLGAPRIIRYIENETGVYTKS